MKTFGLLVAAVLCGVLYFVAVSPVSFFFAFACGCWTLMLIEHVLRRGN